MHSKQQANVYLKRRVGPIAQAAAAAGGQQVVGAEDLRIALNVSYSLYANVKDETSIIAKLILHS